MTNTVLKAQIDSQITNETTPAGITPTDVGTNIKAVVDYVDQQAPIKIYAVTLSQIGTDAPIVDTEYKNTIVDAIVWTRFGAGQYIGTITTDEFTVKTFFATAIPKQGATCTANTTSVNTFILRTYNSSNVLSDDLLDNSQFKIEIYN